MGTFWGNEDISAGLYKFKGNNHSQKKNGNGRISIKQLEKVKVCWVHLSSGVSKCGFNIK